jgi:hypothetical protein
MKQLSFVVVASMAFACSDEKDDPYVPPAPAACTAAQANNTRCSGTTAVQRCTNNTWAAAQTCTSPQVCVTVSATAAACQTPLSTTCTSAEAGDERCNVDVIEICDGTNWVAGQNCATTSQDCVEDAGSASCESASVCSAYPTGEHYVCDGNLTVACVNGVAEGDWNCADLTGDGSVVGVCHDYGGEWQSDCVFPEGTACAFDTGSGTAYMGCGVGSTPSATMGCDWNAGCVTGQTECTPTDPDPFPFYCNGTRLAIDCFDFSEVQQPILIDCALAANGSGTCDATDKVCKHSTTGGLCIPGMIECITPLVCSSTTESGTCGS